MKNFNQPDFGQAHILFKLVFYFRPPPPPRPKSSMCESTRELRPPKNVNYADFSSQEFESSSPELENTKSDLNVERYDQ